MCRKAFEGRCSTHWQVIVRIWSCGHAQDLSVASKWVDQCPKGVPKTSNVTSNEDLNGIGDTSHPQWFSRGFHGIYVDLHIWVWVNTYRYIFSGMNIHLPAILGCTRYQGFDPSPYDHRMGMLVGASDWHPWTKKRPRVFEMSLLADGLQVYVSVCYIFV